MIGLVCASPAFGAVPASDATGDSPAIGDPETLLFTGILLLASVASVGIMRGKGILTRTAFSPPKRTPERLGWGTWTIGAMLVFLCMPIGAEIALTLSGDLEAVRQGSKTLRSEGIQILGATATGAGAGIVLLRIISTREPDLGFHIHRTDPLWGLAGLLAALPIVLVVNIAATWMHTRLMGVAPDPLAHGTLRLMSDTPGSIWWWVTVVGVVVAGPIAEELLYRGFLQSSLVALVRSRWLAIGVTSLLFALAHNGIADWRALPGLFVLSIALGIAFERKARIGVPITMHALFNAFNVLISL